MYIENTKSSNSWGKMKAFKMNVNSKNDPKNDILYQKKVKQEYPSNPHSFAEVIRNRVPTKISINEAIMSLSPRRDGSVLAIPQIVERSGASFLKIGELNLAGEEENASELPLEKLSATIKREKTQLKKR